jgi:hypothetical protein
MALGIINEQWEEFSKKVIPDTASDNQRKAMKRAFYGGAGSLLFSIVGLLDADSEPTDKDLLMMTSIHNELENFSAACLRGEQ